MSILNRRIRKSEKQLSFQKSPNDQRQPAKMAPTYPGPKLQQAMGKPANNKHNHIKVKPTDWPPVKALEPKTEGSCLAGCIFLAIPIIVVVVLVLILKNQYRRNNERRTNLVDGSGDGMELDTFKRGDKMFDSLDEMEAGEMELDGLLESEDGEDMSGAPF